jgi:hypothetical protein
MATAIRMCQAPETFSWFSPTSGESLRVGVVS